MTEGESPESVMTRIYSQSSKIHTCACQCYARGWEEGGRADVDGKFIHFWTQLFKSELALVTQGQIYQSYFSQALGFCTVRILKLSLLFSGFLYSYTVLHFLVMFLPLCPGEGRGGRGFTVLLAILE